MAYCERETFYKLGLANNYFTLYMKLFVVAWIPTRDPSTDTTNPIIDKPVPNSTINSGKYLPYLIPACVFLFIVICVCLAILIIRFVLPHINSLFKLIDLTIVHIFTNSIYIYTVVHHIYIAMLNVPYFLFQESEINCPNRKWKT